MATLNSSLSHLTESQFTLPSVPEATGDFMSDAESFVVLGHSLDCDVNSIVSNTVPDVAQNNIIDIVEQNVDEVLAQLSENSEFPLPAVENHFQLKANYESVNTNSSQLSPDEIEKKISTLIEQNQQLKKTIVQNNMSMKSQYQRIIDWQDDVQKTYQVHKEKFEEARKYINSLKAEIADLKNKLETQANEISDLNNTPDNSCAKSVEKLSLIDNKENEDKIAELNQLLMASKEENENVKAEVQRLHSLLQRSVPKTNVEHQCMTESMQKSRIEEQKAHQEDIKRIRQQLMEAQQKITDLEYNKTLQNNQLAAQNEEINKLGGLLKNLKYSDDDMFALKAQLELYKADFETERNAKEMIRSEKNQLAEDIENLQVRNRQLQEELDLRRTPGDYTRRPSSMDMNRSRSSLTSGVRTNVTPTKFECPKCQFCFTTYQGLENHVHRCLDLDGTLP